MKPPEQQPSKIPIDQAIKNVLLTKRQIPDWLQNLSVDVSLELTNNYPTEPMTEKAVFESLWYFNEMTPKQISELDIKTLGTTLALLETEDQDDLVNRLPPNLEKDFWDLIKKNDPMKQVDE